MTEAAYLRRVVRSVAALARHTVLDCLRSSRVALYEHIHGTEAAVDRLAPELDSRWKKGTGDTLDTLERCSGHPPKWGFDEALKDEAPAWVWEPAAHRVACREDAGLYRRIGELVAGMSDRREQAKVDHLADLLGRRGMVIAYDDYLLSLKLFEAELKRRELPVTLFSGKGGAGVKRKAMRILGRDSKAGRLVALCTDAFSEGMNLQGASVVVHLAAPTVIRTAEQRAGRVDRMDSPHDEIEIWWPRDPAGFAPRKKELLRERHEVVSDLIGANLQMPEQEDDDVIEVEELARQADLERDLDDAQILYDAFRPVRGFVAPEGLVGSEVYDAMRTSQADIVACVSLVRSSRPWGFFAVGGLARVAPRWIFLDGAEAPPEADLGRIAELLVARLGPEAQDRPVDHAAEAVIADLTRRLGACERELLPMRRQRALELAAKVLPKWRKSALARGDTDRERLLARIERMLEPPPGDEAYPDPRSVADAWLRVIRPVQKRVRAESSRRRPLWKLDDLRRPLLDAPVETAALERAFRRIPMLPPVAERVVAMIVGVPEQGRLAP